MDEEPPGEEAIEVAEEGDPALEAEATEVLVCPEPEPTAVVAPEPEINEPGITSGESMEKTQNESC